MPADLRLSLSLAVVALISPACASAGQSVYDAQSRSYRAIEAQAKEGRVEDERLFSAAELDRAALLRAVLHRNPSVESARQAWRAALTRFRQAGAYPEPMLELGLAPLSIPASDVRKGYEVGIRQSLALGGKLDAQTALAAAEAEVAAGDFQGARLELASSADALYHDYFAAVRSIEVQLQHRALIETLKESATAAYASGRGAPSDSLRADAELARLDYQTAAFETERDVAVAQLNALLHREPDAPLPPPPRVLPSLEVDDQSSVQDTAIAGRPDIETARAQAHVARARAEVADADYYPDLALVASYNSMWDMPEHRLMAGVELSIPLERTRRAAALEEAAALAAGSESDVQSLTDAARAEAAVARRRLEQALRGAQLYEQRLLPIARDRIDVVRAGFASGRSEIAELLEAEHDLRSAELDLVMAQVEISRRVAELARALGRIPGLDRDEVQP